MDVYTIAVIVLAIVVVGAFGFFVLRPEKLIKQAGAPDLIPEFSGASGLSWKQRCTK